MCYHTDNENTDTETQNRKGGTNLKELFKLEPEKAS